MYFLKCSFICGCIAASLLLGACARSFVRVETENPGAAVFVNDSAMGVTPWKGLINKGPSHMQVERNGSILLDTSFVANTNGQYLFNSLFFGGATVGLGGYWLLNSSTLLFMGGGLEMGMALFGRDVMIDHKLSLNSSMLAPPRAEPFLHGTGRQTFQILHADSMGRADTLYRTDSLCYESRRQTVWTYDIRNSTHKPIAASALGRCMPGAKTQWKNDPLLPYLGYGILSGAITFGIMNGLDDSYANQDLGTAEKVKTGAILGGTIGFFTGLIIWAISDEHERCAPMQDSLEFHKWLEQYPCQSTAATPVIPNQPTAPVAPASNIVIPSPVVETPVQPIAIPSAPVEPTTPSTTVQPLPADSARTLPNGIRVIQFPVEAQQP